MAIRQIRLEKDEILKKKSREVEVIDEKIQTLIDDMIETMYKHNGVTKVLLDGVEIENKIILSGDGKVYNIEVIL